jgi:hypothetical protein
LVDSLQTGLKVAILLPHPIAGITGVCYHSTPGLIDLFALILVYIPLFAEAWKILQIATYLIIFSI